ncbi:hypothetical protein GJ744_005631 [Endocarpon pusillum]|uniref:XRCC4 coiled-coil domain-containing protein n=1 Tax=Endocarpon pusillum TaxID=364733 RepID=A0A8H7E123_9EURO|nr:hypothetical protein GJ744_005631 [Endocarpon pusillum]
MSKSWVLKFPRSDGDGYLLLEASTANQAALDLNLLATEGVAPYRGKIRQRKIPDLRAKNFHGSDDEWQNILLHVFSPRSAACLPSDQWKGLEVAATIGSGKVTITLRNRIDKITQRLGSVDLSQDDDAEIQLFDWCGSAIDQRSVLEAEQSDLRSKYESAQATVTSLEAKLEEFVKAKADHEEELISKFVLLLNEKKLKIRNQQRILSTAKVDKKKLQQMQKTLEEKGRRAESSRAGKRGADDQTEAAQENSQNDSSDAFEEMDVDKQEGIVAGSQEASSERQTTPETGSETEVDSDSDAAPELTSKAAGPVPKASTSHRAAASQQKKASSPPLKPGKKRQTPTRNISPLPPVRVLPFAKKGAKAKKAAEPEPSKPPTEAGKRDDGKANDSGEETASDDDEL